MENKVTKKEAAKIYRENNSRVVDDTIDGFVVLKDVNKVYDNRVQAVFDFNLSIAQEEFIVLVGPSGCGKSTTLRMIAGLEEITSGYLYIDKILSNYLESKDRDIAMVFQSYALYPNMTVYDNIGFGLKVRGVAKDVIKQKVFEAADILNLGAYLDRKPRELSGGQMQRVALGRAIVRNAKLFLMDEPLSNLDAKLRVQMRSEIVKLHKNIHATTIYVTHDQTEAMTMADRIVIMNKGVVQQIGSPMEIYNDPHNVFVATFIGNPPMNVFKTSLAGGKLTYGDAVITLPKGTEQKYAEFIAGRKAFFEDFKRKADLTAEKELIAKIVDFIAHDKSCGAPVEQVNAFIAAMKGLAPGSPDAEPSVITNAVALFMNDLGFELSEEKRAAIAGYAENRVYDGIRKELSELVERPDALVGRIKQFISVLKKLPPEQLKSEIAAICVDAEATSKENRLIKFDEKMRADITGYAVNADCPALKSALVSLKDNILRLRVFKRLEDICNSAKALAEYKGFIHFDDEREKLLTDDLMRGDFKGLKRDLVALERDLKNTDLAIAGILKKFDSAGVFKAKSKDADIVVPVKKKKKEKPVKVDISVENNELIDRYLEAYGAPDAAEQVYVGIRPEDIHFANEFKGKKSESFKIEASFVELLGSEFNVYVDMFDIRLIMKSGLSQIIKTGDEIELCFDMNKLRLFDAISCERVI